MTPVWHTEEVDKSDLLKELRRDRTPGALPRRRGRRIVLALLVLLLLGGAGWLVTARATVPTVRTAVASSRARTSPSFTTWPSSISTSITLPVTLAETVAWRRAVT